MYSWTACFSILMNGWMNGWDVKCHPILEWFSQTPKGSNRTGSFWSKFPGRSCRISVSGNVGWRGAGRRAPWRPPTPPPFIPTAPCGFSSPRPSARWLSEEGEAGQSLIPGLPAAFLSLVSTRSLCFLREGVKKAASLTTVTHKALSFAINS